MKPSYIPVRVSRNSQLEGDLMTILEDYLETKLFRDTNTPEVNALFWDLYNRIADTSFFYAQAGNPDGYRGVLKRAK